MLYKAIIGPAVPAHPELEAFFTGFQLRCENGFSLLEVSLPSISTELTKSS